MNKAKFLFIIVIMLYFQLPLANIYSDSPMQYLTPSKVTINTSTPRAGAISKIFCSWHDDPSVIKKAKIGIVGIPYDEGIAANNGRVGAKEGPDAIRTALAKLGTTYFVEYGYDLSDAIIIDFGNIEIVPGNPTATYERITAVIDYILSQGVIPVSLGGGHDISQATIKGLAKYLGKKEFGGINIDAHLDVREVVNNIITSGTPFRVALESIKEFQAKHYTTIGVTGNVNSKIYFDYLDSKGAKIITLNKLREIKVEPAMKKALSKDNMFLSVDIDAVSQAHAPGCSAPAILGIEPGELLEMALLAGKSKKIRMMDIVEVNPLFDQDNRTAKLAALTLIYFTAGLYN